MPALPTQQLTNYRSGLINRGAVSENQFPLDAVEEAVNVHFDRIGAVEVRKGITRLGNQISASTNILGLYEFRDSGTGTNNQLITVNGTSSYYLSGSTWTEKRAGLTAGKKSRFTTFLDYVFMCNGADATKTWDGNPGSSFGTTNASGAPVGYFPEVFRNRVWIAGSDTYPDRVWYSSTPSSVTTPVITWDTSVTTGSWIDTSPSDGENITGLIRAKKHLLIFKNNHIYPIYSISETEPDPLINVGTYSNESIVRAKDGFYFHHPSGFYKYTEGSVSHLSQPIKDAVEAISASNYSSISGWEDGDHVYWSVGNISLYGILYSNVVFRYTISSQVWTMYIYPSRMLFGGKYNSGSVIYQVVGDDNGSIHEFNTGTDDNGASIVFTVTGRPLTLDGLYSTRKSVSKVAAYHHRANGSSLLWRTTGEDESAFKPLLTISHTDAYPVSVDMKGNKFWIKWAGESRGEPPVFNGLEILEGYNEIVV